jgi:predicted RNA binding protein YcfA (HicA-like mRNA interferase family)
MNRRIPSLKSKEIIKALKKNNFIERRNTGKHCVLKNPLTGKIIPIPIHGSKDVKRGTVFAIIKQAGLSIEEFLNLL